MRSSFDNRITVASGHPRRNRGEGRIWKMGRIWWIQYYVHGRQVRESSHSDRNPVAERLLRRRLGEIAAGIAAPPNAARVTYEEMRGALLADYAANRRRWLRIDKRGQPYISNIGSLSEFFGHYRAVDITTDALREFIRKRQGEGAANGSINRSLALLRRMFRLAVLDGKVHDVPHFPMLKEAPPRKGFLEHADFQKLRQELPEYLRSVLTMAYYTGMRLGEILNLRWESISFAHAEVRLDPGSTKNGDPRTIPLTEELLEMLRIERQKNPNSKFVFARKDQPIRVLRKAWVAACNRASLPGLLFHDLRRTGLRNLVRAGVPERVAMAISGHKTRAVFERYNIVSGRDLKDAARKLENYLATQNGANSGQIDNSPGKNTKEQNTVIN